MSYKPHLHDLAIMIYKFKKWHKQCAYHSTNRFPTTWVNEIRTCSVVFRLPSPSEKQNRKKPYHGFRRHQDGREAKQPEITVVVWESDGKYLFPKLNFTQFVNRNVKILGRRLYSSIASLKDLAKLDDALIFYVCLYFFPANLVYPTKFTDKCMFAVTANVVTVAYEQFGDTAVLQRLR